MPFRLVRAGVRAARAGRRRVLVHELTSGFCVRRDVGTGAVDDIHHSFRCVLSYLITASLGRRGVAFNVGERTYIIGMTIISANTSSKHIISSSSVAPVYLIFSVLGLRCAAGSFCRGTAAARWFPYPPSQLLPSPSTYLPCSPCFACLLLAGC